MLTDVNYMIPVYLVNLFWLLDNLLGVTIAIFTCFEKQRYRAEERFLLQQSLVLQIAGEAPVSAEVIDITFRSCAVQPAVPAADPDAPVGKRARLFFEPGDLALDAVVYRSRSWGKKLILVFDELTIEQHKSLVRLIFDQQMNGFGQMAGRSTRTLITFRQILLGWWREFVIRR